MRWGRAYLRNLRENRPDLHQQMQADGTLDATVAQIEADASSLYNSVIKALRAKEPLPREYVARANVLAQHERTAREIVDSELIQVPDKMTSEAMSRGRYYE